MARRCRADAPCGLSPWLFAARVAVVWAALAAVAAAGDAPGAPGAPPRLVVLGDSLTAGYGVAREEAFPALLQARLRARGWDWRVVNGGVSGDTTAGGLRRLPWLLRGGARVLVVALGGNDGLRGIAPEETRRNLVAIIDLAREQAPGVQIVLAGMQAPPNLGDPYTAAFAATFPAVARERGVVLVPFLLEGVGGVPDLNQADGIHPTAVGQERLADHLWPYLEPLLRPAPP